MFINWLFGKCGKFLKVLGILLDNLIFFIKDLLILKVIVNLFVFNLIDLLVFIGGIKGLLLVLLIVLLFIIWLVIIVYFLNIVLIVFLFFDFKFNVMKLYVFCVGVVMFGCILL